jgi:hypothetical protein
MFVDYIILLSIYILVVSIIVSFSHNTRYFVNFTSIAIRKSTISISMRMYMYIMIILVNILLIGIINVIVKFFMLDIM